MRKAKRNWPRCENCDGVRYVLEEEDVGLFPRSVKEICIKCGRMYETRGDC